MPDVTLSIDGQSVSVPEGSTILAACRKAKIDTPTLCFLDTLTPVNVCRVCVVELAGSRTLVPSCSRVAQNGMEIQTDSERVRTSRRMVLEFLASSVDVSLAADMQRQMQSYGAHPERYGRGATPSIAGTRDHTVAGHHHAPGGEVAQTVSQPVKVDNQLYVRDYSKCILCYKCVEACGTDAQNTFAIAVAGRGFDARISTEFAVPLGDSACVYCGNCIGVCPTGALMFKTEHDRRAAQTWDETRQTHGQTICSYCGVGCNLDVTVQDGEIVKVMSPAESSVTHGHLCIKGRFGWKYVESKNKKPE
jgi:NADP-reducing hydrogenase subunit HndD